MSKPRSYVAAVLAICALVVLGAVLLPCRSQQMPLEALMVDSTVLPAGWRLDRTVSYEQEDADGADDNLMRVWELEDGESRSVATSFMMIQQYSHALLAAYRYVILTSRDSLPYEVFRTPEHWSYRSDSADKTVVVCTLPTAGTRCRAIARYCQYVVTFQFENPAEEKNEADFQALWEEIDLLVGQRLAR